jgi:hypothetical protein
MGYPTSASAVKHESSFPGPQVRGTGGTLIVVWNVTETGATRPKGL